MVPSSINHLPIELHTHILTFLLSLSRQPVPPSAHDLTRISSSLAVPESQPITLEWVEKASRSPTLFPFNVASVCKLWHDILLRIPDSWTRVVFDVAKDPTPFLDAFSWSKNLEEIDVLVFNSTSDAGEMDKALEARRVCAITVALVPHVPRCKSISFDITYSSSLPPAALFFFYEAPHLEELTLKCCIDDMDVRKDVSTTNSQDRNRLPFATSFPHLTKISLTGFWFMYLALHADDDTWFNKIESEERIELCISRFKFHNEGLYTLPNFAFYLSKIKGFDSISFFDLSLSYEYQDSGLNTTPSRQISADISFEDVSNDFLAHLFAIATIVPEDTLVFDGCQIPNLEKFQDADYLELRNIIDEGEGDSLRHILKVWTGSNLTIHSCPSFNNALLSWLGWKSEIEYAPYTGEILTSSPTIDLQAFKTFPARDIAYIAIKDCKNFTPSLLRKVIKARNDASNAEDEVDSEQIFDTSSVLALHVTGKGPILTKEDKDWFQRNSGRTAVTWSTWSEGI